MATKRSERMEAWFRILVAIVSGIVLGLWGYAISFIAFINWLITVFSGRRNREMAEFCEPWNTEYYKFIRYTTLMSNKRPFPFSSIERMSRFE